MISDRPVPKSSRGIQSFAVCAGLFAGLTILKFGNPVIFDNPRPEDGWELLLLPWPIGWGFFMLAGLAAHGFLAGTRKPFVPVWALVLPVAWFGWQILAAVQTSDAGLTAPVLKHFAACVACFYAGWFALSNARDLRFFWAGLTCGFVLILLSGFVQKFGGLEATRETVYQLPGWRELPPDFLRRLASDRIFATLFYPNTLAAMILLMLPPVLAGAWLLAARFSVPARALLLAILAGGALACLYWSGSKAGWLILLGIVAFALLHLRFDFRWKALIVVILLVGGVAGFFVRYAGFFERGATSVAARFDYWRAGAQIVRANPVLGTGPGTFSKSYQALKPPEAEMARLAHNDYVQQATDSGIPGFIAYTLLVAGSLAKLYRRRFRGGRLEEQAVWLGLLGLHIHSLAEFNLYIPALAWPAFLFLGWLWGLPGNDRMSSREAP